MKNTLAAFYLICFFVLPGTVAAKTAVLFSADAAGTSNPFNTSGGAKTELSSENLSTAQKGWFKISFSEKKYSLAYFNVKRSDFDYFDQVNKKSEKEVINLTAPENVWTGYEQLKFEYLNPSNIEITVRVWLIDFPALAAKGISNELSASILLSETKEPEYLQMCETPLKLKPGKGTASIDLRKELITLDKNRAMDLSDIRAVVFKGDQKTQTVLIDNLRLESSSEEAGKFPAAKFTVICKACKKGSHDAAAPICAFCGADKKIIAVEPEKNKGSASVFPDINATIGPRNGGGGIKVAAAEKGLNLSHYDFGFWENRALLDFKLSGKLLDEFSKIKKAELRLYAKNPGKPFFPVFKVYAISEKNNVQESTLTWLTQPPVEELVFVSGVYPGTERWLNFDITDYIAKKIKAKKSRVIFEIRGGNNFSTYLEPHPLGHYAVFISKYDAQKEKQPYLYIEK
ncbi:MAG: DNRLRE domain-containing protein [Candidatus Firestonebacteria bacterium]